MSDYTLSGEFSKFDEDERIAFGWASVTNLDGQEVVDRQGDIIKIDDLERSAYNYVLSSRVGGEMHKKEIYLDTDGMSKAIGTRPKKVAELVESVVLTPEKIEKMGLPASTPQGWWIGFKVTDDEVWKGVKSGKYSAFSIHGSGKRTPRGVSKSDPVELTEKDRETIARFAKHLMGQHDQQNHSRDDHSFGSKIGSAAGVAVGGALLGRAGRRLGRGIGNVRSARRFDQAADIRSDVAARAGADRGLNQVRMQSETNPHKRQFMMDDDRALRAVRDDYTNQANEMRQGATYRRQDARENFTDAALTGGAGASLFAGGMFGRTQDEEDIDRRKRRSQYAREQGRQVESDWGPRDRIPESMYYKVDRQRELLSRIGSEIAKGGDLADVVMDVCAQIMKLRSDGEIDHDIDIPLDADSYDLAMRVRKDERKADDFYTKSGGEWLKFEDYLNAVGEAMGAGDQETVQKLLGALSS